MNARALLFAAVALPLAAPPPTLQAQRFALEGLAALEAWQTDDGSRLLARNAGRLAAQGRLYAWASFRATSRLELLAVGDVNAGNAETEDFAAEVELLEARLAASRALVLEAGRLLMPIGAFGARRFPHANPVIGMPDLYPPQYPWGVLASGARGPFDYRVALVSLPAINPNYTPEPGDRLRPVLGVGWTFGPALRVGAAWTHGPYLSSAVADSLPAGSRWYDFAQTVASADARFSSGYLEARGELAWSSYEAPYAPDRVRGLGWYVESRVTVSPRLFVALRLERFRYASIAPRDTNNWRANETTEQNGELGVGYRFGAGTLLKLAARRDNWPGPDPSPFFRTPNGYALAAQFVQQFSITALLQPRY
jgi:hypothetical protein